MYYHTNRQIFSADATPAERRNMQQWEQRADPAAAYSKHGWLPVTESLPKFDGSPLTGKKTRTIDESGDTFSWTVEGVRWNQCVDVAAKIETIRNGKIAALTTWWDTHPGIEVETGIILPIQEIGRNTNTAALTLGLVTGADPIELVSVEDYTVTIPAADAPTALGVFKTQYSAISAHWDTTHKALKAATTLAEVEAINVEFVA